jgi:hypothetical protein
VLSFTASPSDLARVKALQCRESGSWLHAVRSNTNIGTLFDIAAFQGCLGLDWVAIFAHPHICTCNAKADEMGTHGLSCI